MQLSINSIVGFPKALPGNTPNIIAKTSNAETTHLSIFALAPLRHCRGIRQPFLSSRSQLTHVEKEKKKLQPLVKTFICKTLD